MTSHRVGAIPSEPEMPIERRQAILSAMGLAPPEFWMFGTCKTCCQRRGFSPESKSHAQTTQEGHLDYDA